MITVDLPWDADALFGLTGEVVSGTEPDWLAQDWEDEFPRSLQAAILLSLRCKARADDDDQTASGERFGWWGDSYAIVEGDRFGSRLWQLQGMRTAADAAEAESMIEEALAWMVEDGIATKVEASVVRSGDDFGRGSIIIHRDETAGATLRLGDLWRYVRA